MNKLPIAAMAAAACCLSAAALAVPAARPPGAVSLDEALDICRLSLTAQVNGTAPSEALRRYEALPVERRPGVTVVCTAYMRGANDLRDLLIAREAARRTV